MPAFQTHGNIRMDWNTSRQLSHTNPGLLRDEPLARHRQQLAHETHRLSEQLLEGRQGRFLHQRSWTSLASQKHNRDTTGRVHDYAHDLDKQQHEHRMAWQKDQLLNYDRSDAGSHRACGGMLPGEQDAPPGNLLPEQSRLKWMLMNLEEERQKEKAAELLAKQEAAAAAAEAAASGAQAVDPDPEEEEPPPPAVWNSGTGQYEGGHEILSRDPALRARHASAILDGFEMTRDRTARLLQATEDSKTTTRDEGPSADEIAEKAKMKQFEKLSNKATEAANVGGGPWFPMQAEALSETRAEDFKACDDMIQKLKAERSRLQLCGLIRAASRIDRTIKMLLKLLAEEKTKLLHDHCDMYLRMEGARVMKELSATINVLRARAGEKYENVFILHQGLSMRLLQRDDDDWAATGKRLRVLVKDAHDILTCNDLFASVEDIELVKEEMEEFVGEGGQLDNLITKYETLLAEHDAGAPAPAPEAPETFQRYENVQDDEGSHRDTQALAELVKDLHRVKKKLLQGIQAQLDGAQHSFDMRVTVLKANWKRLEDLIEETGIAILVLLDELPNEPEQETFKTFQLVEEAEQIVEDMYNGNIKLNIRTNKWPEPQ